MSTQRVINIKIPVFEIGELRVMKEEDDVVSSSVQPKISVCS